MLFTLSLAQAASVTLNPGDDVATLTASLIAGDVVTFNPGTYSLSNTLTWTGQGTASAPITLKGDGATLVLESGWAAIHVQDAAYMEITGFTIQSGATRTDAHYGIYLENADHVTIRDNDLGPITGAVVAGTGTLNMLDISHNEMHDTIDGDGIWLGCDDAQCWLESSTISNNWIHDLGGTYNYGLYVAMGGQGNTIVDNVIYNNLYRGLSVHSTEYGPPNEVRGNAIWSVGDIGLYVRGASRVWNNVVFDVTGVGLYLTRNDHDILDDVVVSHNTVWNTTSWSVYMEYWAGRTGNVFANNAISNINGYALRVADGGVDDAVLFSNNVVSGLVEGIDVSSAGGPVLPGRGDADFNDPLTWDFYPAGGSALLGAGDPDGYVPDVDFNGVARDGSAPDVGAYERASDTNPGWIIQEGFKDTSEVKTDDGAAVGGCCEEDGSAESALLLAPLGLLWRRRRDRR